MSVQHSDACFMRLVQNLKQNTDKHKNVSLLIGAGCSLTSSEKDITTQGIIESLVRKYSMDDNIPNTWVELYKRFVNEVWEGQGNRDRIQLLEDYFTDMVPSDGYKAMRWLIDQGYISNIITTNFDLMIDTILEGLSYQLIVGEHEEVIGTEPTFTLMKVHGDLKYGSLRFAPHELVKLPDKICSRVQELTHGVVLVVGFRGQDIGILNALDTCSDYGAFWAVKKCLEQWNSYENAPIYSWMRKRNSEANFLFGDTYGTFDELFRSLQKTLSDLSKKEHQQCSSKFSKIWESRFLFDYFRLNARFQSLFEVMHQQLDQQLQHSSWRITEPYCASNYETLLDAAIKIISPNVIPDEYLYCIGNEVDALLFSLSCSICVACQGYPFLPQDIVSNIRQNCETEMNSIIIGKEFWDAVAMLSSTTLAERDSRFHFDAPLAFSFDKNDNLQTVLKHVDMDGMHSLLATVLTLLLFMKTSSDEGTFLLAMQRKQILEQHLFDVKRYDNLIRLQMSNISREDYENIYQVLLHYSFFQTVINCEYVLSRDIIRVSFPVKESHIVAISNRWDLLVQQTYEYYEQFFADFISEQYQPRKYMKVFSEFLASPSVALFVTGDSGSGKTTALKLWLASLDTVEYLICPILGRRKNHGWDGVEIWEEFNQVKYIEVMLEQRRQTFILVFDAINEMGGTFSELSAFYTTLLGFADKLAREKFTKFKIIFSCRTDFYLQLKRSSGIEPSSSSFFTADSEDPGIFRVPLLSKKEVRSFLNLHQFPNPVSVEELFHEFGEMIYLPINLNYICYAYANEQASTQTKKWTSLYDRYFHNLFATAEKDALSATTLQAVMFQVIEYRFFEGVGSQIITHRLSTDLSRNYPNAMSAYNWLVDHKIFVRHNNDSNIIQFSHDRIEEYFLSQYILIKEKERFAILDQVITGESFSHPIVRNAICDALLILFHTDNLSFVFCTVSVIREHNDLMLPQVVDALLQIARKSNEEISSLLSNFERYLTKSEYKYFLFFLLRQIQQMLDDKTDVGRTALDAIGTVVGESIENDPVFRVYSNYLMAKQRYLFPGEDDRKAFQDALQLCRIANKYLTESIADHLVDDVQILEALLLQNQGLLNEAVDLMSACHQRQEKASMYDLACQSALYLGAMYRELTRFDDAIELYDSIDVSLVSVQLLLNRLNMNKGIILKNKIQNAFFNGQKNTEENLQYYFQALSYFQETCAFAEEVGDISLQLEIYAERVELACIAYDLDLGTINDAASWAEKMDEVILLYRRPVPRIQRHRMWARVYTLNRDYNSAIDHLERGFSIAVDYNIPFRATDCCNQITGIICSTLEIESFCTREILEKGLRYGDYSISYYRQLQNENHRYLQDSIVKYNKILVAHNTRFS